MTAREPKQDRSRVTRQLLLESTVDCLAEHGWAATTVTVAAEKAGVSRGAAQHHFPTREDLITAALEHMFDTRMADQYQTMYFRAFDDGNFQKVRKAFGIN